MRLWGAALRGLPASLRLSAAIVVVDVDRLSGREGPRRGEGDARVEEHEPRRAARAVDVQELDELRTHHECQDRERATRRPRPPCRRGQRVDGRDREHEEEDGERGEADRVSGRP